MQCPTCFGRRLFLFQGRLVPCPDCEGFGSIHCCDGLQAQAEGASNGVEPPAPAVTEDTEPADAATAAALSGRAPARQS